LEIGKIVNSNVADRFQVSITTQNTIPAIIDGPPKSFSFPIKRNTGYHVSTQFMRIKTLYDVEAGHAHGQNPDASTSSFAISDSDISTELNGEFVSLMLRNGNPVFCTTAGADAGLCRLL
jgi:hypothetical protein